MRKSGYVLVLLSIFIFLCGAKKSAFAFPCVGPAENNCLACHGGPGGQTPGGNLYPDGYIHSFHVGQLDVSCMICHCGAEGVSPCPPAWGPADTHCCTTCHNQCYRVNEHTLNGYIDCTACHTSTTIGTDDDCDGICNPGEVGQCTGSDNCPRTPNGPGLGTCTSGLTGANCISDIDCGAGGFCSINQEDTDQDGPGDVCDNCPADPNPNQEDTYPPQGNGIGDVCDCEGDFNCDGNVDASDINPFLADFGRSNYTDPCTNLDPCNGDFNCDVNVDAQDVTIFLEDFGRSDFNNPCPVCVPGTWCSY